MDTLLHHIAVFPHMRTNIEAEPLWILKERGDELELRLKEAVMDEIGEGDSSNRPKADFPSECRKPAF